MRDKIKINSTGEITYCYTIYENDGATRKIGNKEYPIQTPHYYKSEDKSEGEWNRDEITVIPQYPYELFGIECGKGWHDLLKPIFEYIENYNQDKDDEHKIEIHQIKEKFGELCVYPNFYTDELRELIHKAEDEASNTCELCGSKEDVGMACEGWLTTKCHKCMKEWCMENEKPHRWRRNSDNKIYWINPDGDDELFDFDEKN